MSAPHVLIVDDDPLLGRALARVLERHGVRTDVAQNGVDALRILEERTFDLVISDVRMPVMDGATMLEALKARGAAVPTVVFLTAHGDHSEEELLARGAQAVFAKPLPASRVVEIVTRFSQAA